MSKMLAKSFKTRQVFLSSVNKRFGKKVKMKALKIKGTVIQIRKAIAKAQKGRSLNGCSKKTKHIKFSEKKHFLPPDTHVRVRIRGYEMFVFRKIWRALFS